MNFNPSFFGVQEVLYVITACGSSGFGYRNQLTFIDKMIFIFDGILNVVCLVIIDKDRECFGCLIIFVSSQYNGTSLCCQFNKLTGIFVCIFLIKNKVCIFICILIMFIILIQCIFNDFFYHGFKFVVF